MEIKYIIQVDSKGIQRLCLSDGTPVPAQIESILYQDTEQARQGICTFSVLVLAEDKIGLNASKTIRPTKDGWGFELPDGRGLEVDSYIRRQTTNGANCVQLVVTAKLVPTIEIGGISENANLVDVNEPIETTIPDWAEGVLKG